MKFTVCQLCKQELKPHERKEGFCDPCLRARQTMPSMNPEPKQIRGGELTKIEPQLPDWRAELA